MEVTEQPVKELFFSADRRHTHTHMDTIIQAESDDRVLKKTGVIAVIVLLLCLQHGVGRRIEP